MNLAVSLVHRRRRRRLCELASIFDGVLANFVSSFQRLTVEVVRKNLFHPSDDTHPPCWDWFSLRGYTRDEMRLVWAAVDTSYEFWTRLRELPGCSTLRMVCPDLVRNHEVYFVTSREHGRDVKWQTEQWLMLHLCTELPTVLVTGEKGLVAKALKLDCYLDDNLDNVNAVVRTTLAPTTSAADISNGITERPTCRTYLLNRSYNQSPAAGVTDRHVVRVETLGQFLDKELVNL